MFRIRLITQAATFALCAASISIPNQTSRANAAYMVNNDDYNNCVDVTDNQLHNGCGYTVWVTWCVENVDCNNGKFTNLEDIGADKSYPVYGAHTGNVVHYGVCKAPMMPMTNDTPAYSYQFRCG